MKLISENKGFTLIETLVSINISFTAITLILTFYLFALKFSESVSRNYTDKYIQISFFNNLERTLRKSDEYSINIFNGKIIVHTSNADSIYISQDSISLNGLFSISDIKNLGISISTDTNEEIIVKNWEVISDPTSILASINSINSILFEIEKNKKNYSYQIFSLRTSVSKFKDIEKEKFRTGSYQ